MLVIERTTLLKIARDTAAQRLAARRSLISAYLTGSVAADEPLLGEATDIDLILIDSEPPPVAREIIRLTDQVALDIQYRYKAEYANAKTLRVHPWRGPEICAPFFLLDPSHFFELAQANVRGQFHRPDFVAARARAFAALALDAVHVGLLPGQEGSEPVTVEAFCRSLLYAANALITLTAFPAGGRRLLLKLEAATQKLKRPDLYAAFLPVLEEAELDVSRANGLLQSWSAAYRAGQSVEDELVHPARRTIYERGFKAQIDADRAGEMLWLMLYTWQALLKNLPGDSPHADQWRSFLEQVHMGTPADFAARVEQARAYVTLAAETVESWAEQNGA
jgi:hypothetical protein